MRYLKFLIPALAAGFLAACGGGGSSAPAETPPAETPAATTVAVTLSAQVYDQAIANAEVSVFVGTSTTPVATTMTDGSGNFSVDLMVMEASRANNCVIVARRDNVTLRSLLGNVGAIADTATANNGTVTAAELPSANVTNVSTAVAAIIEQSGGSLPSSQADIDAAVAAIADDPATQQIVLQIAAAIKAVVDYGADTTSVGTATNTDELATALAASTTLLADLEAVVASTTADAVVDLTALILEVAGDPLLATQLPSDAATLVTGLVGNSYVFNNDFNEETFVRFDTTTTLTIAEYADIETGGVSGTYVDNLDGSITVNFVDPFDGPTEVVATVTGGSSNSILVTLVSAGDPDETATLRRMIPINGAGGPAIEDIAGGIFVDIDTSTALQLGATCNGSTNDATLRSGTGATPATCSIAEGMLVIDTGSVKTMHGLLADSWNGTTVSQQVSVVNWEADATLGSVASYSRLYTPIDAGIPSLGPVLRIFPSDRSGNVSAQIRFMNVVDVPGDLDATGSLDFYNQNGSSGTRAHIVGTTTDLTGSVLVNGSTNGTFGDSSSVTGINLGNNANSRLNAIFRSSDNTFSTRYQYKLSPITAADVAGKTFIFNDLVFAGDTSPITFSADDGTGGGTAFSTYTNNNGVEVAETLIWKIKVAPIPTNLANSAVANYGTTLSVTLEDGTTDYLFGKKLGTTTILGGYNVNASGAYVENLGAVITPSTDVVTAPGGGTTPPVVACDTTGITTEANFISTVLSNCTVTTFDGLDLGGRTTGLTFEGKTNEVYTFSADGSGTFTNDQSNFFGSITWVVDGNGMLDITYNDGADSFRDLWAIVGVSNTGFVMTAYTDETLAAGEAATFNEVLIPASSAATALSCNYVTTFDASGPTNYNSFTDFETVVSNCANEVPQTVGGAIGTYVETNIEADGSTTTYTNTLNANLTGTYLGVNSGFGTFESGTFSWLVDQNARIVITGTGASAGYVDIVAVLDDGRYVIYSEDSFYGNSPDLIADSTADGIIFSTILIEQVPQ